MEQSMCGFQKFKKKFDDMNKYNLKNTTKFLKNIL